MPQAAESRLIGRADQLEGVRTALSASARANRSALLVSGEAGMGKTSLLRAAIEGWHHDDLALGWGTCWQGGAAPGFWPWMQAFDDLFRAVGPEAAAAAVAASDRDMLSVLIRDLGPGTETSTDPDRHRLLLLDVAVRWIEALAIDRHVVIVLDDLQWADASTFDLLDQVIAAPVAARLLVTGAYRHDELTPEAAARLATLSSHVDGIHLEGLTVSDVEQLVGAIGDPRTAAQLAPALHRRSGGHPLFVRELARMPEQRAGDPLPTVVSGAVTRRLNALPDDSRKVLESASGAGNRLLTDVLGAVTDQSPATIVDHLAPAIAAGLIRTTPAGEFWFAHDLIRETLYAELNAARRSHLHARIGEALVARGERGATVSAGDIAYHLALGIRAGEPAAAVHWAAEAAREERRRSAFTEAAGHLRRVRVAAADAAWTIDPETLVRLLIDEADSQARSGDPDAARGLLTDAARLAPDPGLQADAALAVQRLGAKFSTPRGEIIAQLESALRAVADVDVARQAQLTAALARELQHSVAEDRPRVRALSEEALELGRASGDDHTIVACLLAHHDALWEPGTGLQRAELGHEIAVVANRLGDLDRQTEGMLIEANGLLEAGSAGFRTVLDRWFGLLEARSEPPDRYMVKTRRAALALLDGDRVRAEDLIEQAALLGEDLHEPDTGNVLMSQRVALAFIGDDPEELSELATDAVRWWTGAPVLAHAVAAGAYARAGDLDSAAREVAIVESAGGWRAEGSYLRSVLIMHLADAASATDDRDLCRDLFEHIGPLTGGCGVNGAVVAFAGPFAHAAGVLAAAMGDTDHATLHLTRSIDIARAVGANAWIRRSEAELRGLTGTARPRVKSADDEHAAAGASLLRNGKVWDIGWGVEQASVPHMKGLADLAVLVAHPGQDVSALRLAGGLAAAGSSTDDLIDLKALGAYRDRIDELDSEIDQASNGADLGTVERLESEREELLAEIRRTTGLGGRPRVGANHPAERARKAVSARIRDAIRHLESVAPLLAEHLDRSIRTGLECSYAPEGKDATVRWKTST